MAKLIKGNNVQNIITDGDVIVTSPSKIGKTLDKVLDEQQSDIDKLKSNVKYIYTYGGVGGSGSGGGGNGEKPITIHITLGNKGFKDDTIILNGKGIYKLYVKINNASGKNFYMGFAINDSVSENIMTYRFNGDNRYSQDIDINLDRNGTLNVSISDDEGNIVGYYSQDYIVESERFAVSLNYTDINGEIQSYISEPYECFINDYNRTQRHFKIDYSIFLINYTDVNVKCEIDGFDEPIYEGSGKGVIIPIEGDNCEVNINGIPILDNRNMGTYTLRATLTYTINGSEISRTRTFRFSVIPSGLYVDVRTIGDILYDDEQILLNDINNGGGIPYKYISQGTSLMMYCKVFEGYLDGNPNRYYATFTTFECDRIDEDGNIIWREGSEVAEEYLEEQKESKNGTSVVFSTPGIKKIEITVVGKKGVDANVSKTFTKFVYVKEFSSSCDWYDGEKVEDDDIENTGKHIAIYDSYFRANQGNNTYKNFPQLLSNNGVLSLSTSSVPITISHDGWELQAGRNFCTVISFGIQVSNVNSENSKIIDIFTTASNEPKYSLTLTTLFENSNKIAIPTEVLNKDKNNQYHLIQIIRYMSDTSEGSASFEDCLYIDGLLESSDSVSSETPSVISKLILNNINICYNLINVQYFNPINNNNYKFNPDAFAYQYWLSYKEKYVNSDSEIRLTNEEKIFKELIYRFGFDGTNVVFEDQSIINDISKVSNLPIVIFRYNCNSNSDYSRVSDFMNMMWEGRKNGDTTFYSRPIQLYWIPKKTGGDLSNFEVKIPNNLTDKDGTNIVSHWAIDLQGTSTMRNRIKNFSLKIKSEQENIKGKMLFSPNFDINDSDTFLPENEWTIKADIADSAHANNTSIGKFVNRVCTKINTQISDINDINGAGNFIKNTLEGIPVLMFFMCEGLDDNKDNPQEIIKIYYFGIYNFNLGRTSYYNLGYTGGKTSNGRSDYMTVFRNLKNKIETKYYRDNNTSFTFSVGELIMSPNLAIAEIQDNFPEFDFHQCQPSLLFAGEDNRSCMFGSDSKIVANNVADAKKALTKLVRNIAKAGKYCFQKAGRKNDFVISQKHYYDENGIFIEDGNDCINRYTECKIPDPIRQMRYVNNKVEWFNPIDAQGNEYDDFKSVNESHLKDLITTYFNNNKQNIPILNYTSAAEYYTICMAFGMVDSVLKNMNLKNFGGVDREQFYCAFYDMDCALGEDNSGKETISHFAATDYWYSDIKNGKVQEITRKNDYWDNTIGKGFDFTSSYLFAVVKYAKAILGNDYNQNLNNYPQNFWAKLRCSGGQLESADKFINEYFNSGVLNTFEYLASLNYRVKYLYNGYVFSDDNDTQILRPLANVSAFNGSRRIKVKDWLTKRLRYFDIMMNVNNLDIPICDGCEFSIPLHEDEYDIKLSTNNDITILHSAFDSSQYNAALVEFNGDVKICASKYTPFITRFGTNKVNMYLLPNDINVPNVLYLQIVPSVSSRFYGSSLFTSVDKIESMFTDYRSIISDNIEIVKYGGTSIPKIGGGFTIDSKSVREIHLNSSSFIDKLTITDKCISLEILNIAESGLYGVFADFLNLQEVNISGVNASNGIVVSNSNYLRGERFYISGSSEKKTTLPSLDISGVTGNFNCVNTHISNIRITNTADRMSEFSISGDMALVSLTLAGFRKVSITNCNNIETLQIDDALEELYIDFVKYKKDDPVSKLTKIYLNKDDIGESDIESGYTGEDGVFDFRNYDNLRKVTLKNCDNLEYVILPDRDIETDGMSNNPILKWIDTGSLPSFSDEYDYNGKAGTQYAGKVFRKYSDSPKLILCSSDVFSNCPNYAMLRRDYNKGTEMVDVGPAGYMPYAYTNILVSDNCISLANTFNVSSYIDGDMFNMDTAIRFIEKCVPDDVKGNITSLSGCFSGRRNVTYNKSSASKDKFNEKNNINALNHPTLNGYTSVNDISKMYYNTGVTFISKSLLDLPFGKNSLENSLSWSNFIGEMSSVDISDDALYNISYRLKSYSDIIFNIYEFIEYDNTPNIDNDGYYRLAGNSEDNKFKICDFFFPFTVEDKKGEKIYNESEGYSFSTGTKVYEHIKSLTSLKFGDQYIDFRGMFYLFPYINSIYSSFNGNLSKYDMRKLLKPCTQIISIINSFNDSHINTSTQILDLYNFFNWEGNVSDIEHLFENIETNVSSNGFVVKKSITYNELQNIFAKIATYKKLSRLTNIFSYCTITGYNNEEIKFNVNDKLLNIVNISNLFEYCTSTCKPFENEPVNTKGIYRGGVLNIGRSFFETLPNVTVARRTFAGTCLSSSLTYDFFCKRKENCTETTVSLNSDGSNECKLYMYEYNSSLNNLEGCFCDTKFVNCKNWFDNNNDVNKNFLRNYIICGDKIYDEIGTEYYKYNSMNNSYDKYILDNDMFDDCLDNYTDFVPKNSISVGGDPIVIHNHDLLQDFTYYGNIISGAKPFDPINERCADTIQSTYCCIPPDFLYGCNSDANINNIFANSNIVGVIPRNLTKKIKSKSISSIFKNVNIMPNLEYYYNKEDVKDDDNMGVGLDSILTKIENTFDIKGDTINDNYCVIFRDKLGLLKKRKPVASDRSLGQFVYVPANFTTCGSLMNAFNFRYNLPRHWGMPSKPDGYYQDGFKTTQDLENAIVNQELYLSYHTQYYFMSDNSVNWNNLYDARNVFITSGEDIDFSNENTIGQVRTFYVKDNGGEINEDEMYSWIKGYKIYSPQSWKDSNIIRNFNIDLNLCGQKNDYSMINDYGCPIDIKNSVYLDNFVSGILTIFLNGRVFYDSFEVGNLSTSRHKSDGSQSIINYYGYGKNIILPKYTTRLYEDNFVFIPINNSNIYYDFMLNGKSTYLYEDHFGERLNDENRNIFTTDYLKYKFI